MNSTPAASKVRGDAPDKRKVARRSFQVFCKTFQRVPWQAYLGAISLPSLAGFQKKKPPEGGFSIQT
jgi:hypothetical protein